MNPVAKLVDFVIHIDRHLDAIILEHGAWTYVILFLIIFAETGFVLTPFLPGDSLLFAAGAIAGRGTLDVLLLFAILAAAAIAGDTVNYAVGRYLGPRILRSESARFLNRRHLARTEAFFQRWGGKTIIIARFVPIVRTFAPFVAGVGSMSYPRFVLFNVAGGILWVSICLFAGYFFGGLPFVKNNFSLVVIAIIVISLLPILFEYVRHRRAARRETA